MSRGDPLQQYALREILTVRAIEWTFIEEDVRG